MAETVPRVCIAGMATAYLMCKDPGLWERSYRRTAIAATATAGPLAQHEGMAILSNLMRGAAAAIVAAAGCCALAQAPAPVQTDVGPPPAEERDSVGAVVLQNSMVRAQREALAGRYTPISVTSVGRNVIRATRAARAKEELQQQRDEDAIRLHEMGAGSLTQP